MVCPEGPVWSPRNTSPAGNGFNYRVSNKLIGTYSGVKLRRPARVLALVVGCGENVTAVTNLESNPILLELHV